VADTVYCVLQSQQHVQLDIVTNNKMKQHGAVKSTHKIQTQIIKHK